MRLKFADRSDWSGLLARRFIVRRLDSAEYHGYVTLLHIAEISEPFDVFFQGERVRIAARGYDWVQHFPDGEHYTLLAAFDEQGELVQWYIDVIGGSGLDERGIPYYEDLYLDIVISPQGEPLVLDVEELDQALKRGEVSPVEYDFAWRIVSSLLTALEEDLLPLLWLSESHRALLMRELE